MKELPNTSFDYYTLPNKISCGILGIWPIDEGSSTFSKIFTYCRVIVAITALNSVFVPEIMAIAVNWGDIQILTARREKAHELYNEIRSLWDATDDPNEKKSYQQIAYWARTVTITFYACVLCNQRYSNITVRYGTDISASPKFEIAFFCQLLACIVGISAITGVDCTFMTIILHVAGQFKLIKTWINKIGNEINRESVHLDKFEMDLFKCIRHHQRIIHVVDDINNLLTPILFMQLLTSGIEICLSGYAMLDNGAAVIDIMKFTTHFISMAVELLLWCWPGEILVHESEEIGQVFNTAASYFTLLRKMQD
ncbi:hypothetical protein E2986_04409 [Frieseomelitta varia]|uniref:Odorant receptor n=1 Tax=Frieseomelitta varia TaxID=561572 RepID=A0A833W4L7_9HYME|nr:hypothetical protein E2986_04409 [Frieseomelitta varia]